MSKADVDPLEATVAPVSSEGATMVSGVDMSARADYQTLLPLEAPHYSVSGELARGGMGRIQIARDRRLGRTVALKTLLVSAEELRVRFEREARITARLQHPAIVPVYEAGVLESGEPFYAMKLVSGRPFDDVIAATRTLADRIALLPNVVAVVDALAYAHEQKIVHRDLKPQNVLVGKHGETIVVDWGLAKDLAVAPPADERRYAGPTAPDGEDLTMHGAVMGTPAYMPPEQAEGHSVDERADVYALGALLYHLLAGSAPYRGKSSHDVIVSVLAAPPRPLGELVPDVPRDLVTLVEAAMARDPAARPTAARLAEDLRRFQTGRLVSAHHYTFGELLRRWLRKFRLPLAIVAVALVVIAVLSVVGIREIVRRRDAAVAASIVADKQRESAEKSTRALYLEEGRTELVAGHPQRALPWLQKAYVGTEDTSDDLRLLLAAALVGPETTRVALPSAPEAQWAGDKIVLTQDDGTTTVVDRTGKLVSSLGRVRPLPDVAPRDPLLRRSGDAIALYNLTTGRPGPALFHGATDWVAESATHLFVHPTGTTHVLVIDESSGATLATIEGPQRAPAVAADQYLAAVDASDHLGLWELATGQRSVDLPIPGVLADDTFAIAFDGAHESLVVRHGQLGAFLDIATHQLQVPGSDNHVIGELYPLMHGFALQLEGHPVRWAGEEVLPLQDTGFIIAGKYNDALVEAEDDPLITWFEDGTEPTQLPNHAVVISAFLSTANQLVTVGDSAVSVWHRNGTLVDSFELDPSLNVDTPAEVSGDDWLLVHQGTHNAVWKPQHGLLPSIAMAPDDVLPSSEEHPVARFLDATHVFASTTQAAVLHDLATGTTRSWSGITAVSPDGTRIAVFDHNLAEIDSLSTGAALPLERAVFSATKQATWSADGRYLAAETGQGAVVINAMTGHIQFADADWDNIAVLDGAFMIHSTETGLDRVDFNGDVKAHVEATVDVNQVPVLAPDRHHFIDLEGAQLVLRDATTLASVATFGASTAPVIRPDGSEIVALDALGATVYAPSGARITTLADPGARAVWFVDSNHIATATANEVHVWSHDGALLLALPAEQPITSGAASPDGHLIVAADDNLEVYLWKLDYEQRTPTVIMSLVERLSRWRLENTRLVPR